MHSYCTHTALILHSYCTHTALILHYISETADALRKENLPDRVLSLHNEVSSLRASVSDLTAGKQRLEEQLVS
jgi:hypothetical protein